MTSETSSFVVRRSLNASSKLITLCVLVRHICLDLVISNLSLHCEVVHCIRYINSTVASTFGVFWPALPELFPMHYEYRSGDNDARVGHPSSEFHYTIEEP